MDSYGRFTATSARAMAAWYSVFSSEDGEKEERASSVSTGLFSPSSSLALSRGDWLDACESWLQADAAEKTVAAVNIIDKKCTERVMLLIDSN